MKTLNFPFDLMCFTYSVTDSGCLSLQESVTCPFPADALDKETQYSSVRSSPLMR